MERLRGRRESTANHGADAPEVYGAFRTFGQRVFADGALPSKTKELVAVAVAHVTQCPYCIRGHTDLALKKGATEQEIMEAIWVAAEMRAGAAYAHSVLAIDTMHQAEAKPGAQSDATVAHRRCLALPAKLRDDSDERAHQGMAVYRLRQNRGAAELHAMTIGAIGGLTIGMMTRTARGHTERPLTADGFELMCCARRWQAPVGN